MDSQYNSTGNLNVHVAFGDKQSIDTEVDLQFFSSSSERKNNEVNDNSPITSNNDHNNVKEVISGKSFPEKTEWSCRTVNTSLEGDKDTNLDLLAVVSTQETPSGCQTDPPLLTAHASPRISGETTRTTIPIPHQDHLPSPKSTMSCCLEVPVQQSQVLPAYGTRHKAQRRPVGYVPDTKITEASAGRKIRNPTRQRATGSFPRECFSHEPTLEELQSQSFTDYVRDMVLPTASPFVHSHGEDNYDDFNRIHQYKPMKLTEGMAKVTLPEGFRDMALIGNDTSGRGPEWQSGTPLGEVMVSSPIQQNMLGLAGVYEYTFGEKPPLTVAAFRQKADLYRQQQIGTAVTEDTSNDTMYKLARKFWQKLGPTMAPSLYGADQEGSLFGADPASGWSISQLDSCLHVLANLPGVTSPYLYAGMWASVFCAHTEDMNLMSINYLHAGAPKIWYAIAPGPDSDRFQALCSFSYSQQARTCKEFMRHKRVLVSPSILDREGIRYTTTIQRPGDAVITFPGGYHFGFNAGFNMAEATNFGVPEWIPYGLKAKVCMCRPDSVRIDVHRLIALLNLHGEAEEVEPGLSWKEWADRRALKILSEQAAEKRQHQALAKKKQVASMKKDFWVEVTQPPAKMRKKGKRKGPTVVWRLAKPTTRNSVTKGTRILLFLPEKMLLGEKNRRIKVTSDGEDPDNVEEGCFCGRVVDEMDNHVRIKFDGLPKSSDRWIRRTSTKLFLDGGAWEKSDTKRAKKEIGVTHFWQEEDSKKLGVDL